MTTYRAGSRLERIGLLVFGFIVVGLASPFAITAFRVASARFLIAIFSALAAWIFVLYGLYLIACAMRNRLPQWYTESIWRV